MLRQPDQNTNIKKNQHPTTKSFTYKLHVEYISLQKCYRGTQSMLEANIVRSDQEHNIQHSLVLKASKEEFPSSTHVCRLLWHPGRTGPGSVRGKSHAQLLPQVDGAAAHPLVPSTAGNERPLGQGSYGRMGGNLCMCKESSQRHSSEERYLTEMDKTQ